MWSLVSQLKLSANDEKYPHVINIDKGNSEDRQKEETVEASLPDSLEGNSARFAQLHVWPFAPFFCSLGRGDCRSCRKLKCCCVIAINE